MLWLILVRGVAAGTVGKPTTILEPSLLEFKQVSTMWQGRVTKAAIMQDCNMSCL